MIFRTFSSGQYYDVQEFCESDRPRQTARPLWAERCAQLSALFKFINTRQITWRSKAP